MTGKLRQKLTGSALLVADSQALGLARRADGGLSKSHHCQGAQTWAAAGEVSTSPAAPDVL